MFAEKGYHLIRKLVSKDVCNTSYRYLMNKRNVYFYLLSCGTLEARNRYKEYGWFGDAQSPNSWSCYNDLLMTTLFIDVKPIIEKEIGLKLIETYTYTRLYVYGAELHKHKDRQSCDFSATMNLGGDSWPIFMDGEKIDLQEGDCCIYRGCEIEHWRERFTGIQCGQVFFHYNDINNPMSSEKYDGKVMLGLPGFDMNF